MIKKIILFCLAFLLLSGVGAYLGFKSIKESLPKIISIHDYEPLLVSQVFDRNHKKIGEFFRQRRILVPYEKIPSHLVNAFLAAEDDQFFHHKGINYQAILRASIANIKARKSVQGGSTITQQVAKTFFLSPEKTLLRKIREAMLAMQIEENMKKEEILYLYLNQIYFGQGAYGVEAAAQSYFRKSVGQLNLSEMAILAGLPQAPSSYSPVKNPHKAKERQTYVLKRMAEVGFISDEESEKAIKEPVKVYLNEDYDDYAPYYLETVRQLLSAQLGEDQVLDKGLTIYTSLDLDQQKAAHKAVIASLKSLDKRQGYRGPIKSILDPSEQTEFLNQVRNQLIFNITPERIIGPDGKFADIKIEPTKTSSTNLPFYQNIGDTVTGIVDRVDDTKGLVFVKIPDSQGIISMSSMEWARKPDPKKNYIYDLIRKPSSALKKGDVILVTIVAEKFSRPPKPSKNKDRFSLPTIKDESQYLALQLDQEPQAEGALISFDQKTEDILAMVGGYKFERKKNEFNRAVQAARQTGSIFKSIVYASALDKGFNPASLIMDVPIVFEEKVAKDDGDSAEGQQEETRVWKPTNHSKSFSGEIIFRNALVKSLNSPTVKIMEELGVNWVTDYGKRLGIFSQLNQDLTLALGSSSVTLYEMTKVFSQFGRLGKRIRPKIIENVLDRHGQQILGSVSLDIRFHKELDEIESQFKERRSAYLAAPESEKSKDSKKTESHLFFNDPDQLIDPKTAYITTSLLKGVIEDPYGTGAGARSLGREAAGKTGSTNGYYDAWFIGFTPQIVAGVWVGYDREQSLGVGEVGGRAALPAWLEYMKQAHANLPEMTFPVPDGIVFVNIDGETGKLASARSKRIIRQAFVEGTEPTSSSAEAAEDKNNFYKQDLNE